MGFNTAFKLRKHNTIVSVRNARYAQQFKHSIFTVCVAQLAYRLHSAMLKMQPLTKPIKAQDLFYVPPASKFINPTFCPQCIHAFCMDLITNSDYFLMQLQFIGFYNRCRECLLRGTNWVFK
jgi:hypothetical protein